MKQDEIDAINKIIDAEKKKLDAINETIDARKKAIELLKGEKDHEEEMAEKNKAISDIDGLNSAYHIGGSYLLKYASYNKAEAFERLSSLIVAAMASVCDRPASL